MGSALDRARAKYGDGAGTALDRAKQKYEPEPEKSGAGQAALLGGAQGASFGTADELTGVATGLLATKPLKWLREKTGILPPNEDGTDPFAPTGGGFSEAYHEGRDSARMDLEQSRKDHPVIAYGSEIATSIANPIKLGPGAAGAGAKFGEKVVRAAGRGAAEGAAYSAGASTADTTGGVLKDTLKGGGIGAAGAVAATAGGEVWRKVGQGKVDRLEKRILNEAAEGDPGSRPANLTNRRKLEKAEENIVREVIHGPDGKAVRAAIQSPPAEAIEKLQPIIDKRAAVADAGYTAFEAAGKGTVDTGEYAGRLHQKLLQAKTLAEKRGIERLINDYGELVERNGGAPLTLREVRAHTTSIQDIHESVLGITPTAAGKLKGRLSAAASEAMDDALDAAAAGNPKLQEAAQSIRASNESMNALLTLKRVKTTQLGGEATGKSPLVRAGERAGAAVGGGALGAAYSLSQDPEHAARNIALGAAAGGLAKAIPAATRAIDRGITTRAIDAARRGTTSVPPSLGANVAEIAARGMSRNAVQALARLTLGTGTEEQAKAAGASDDDIRMAKRAGERRVREAK